MINWQLLGEYFLPHVDIDAELGGGDYRRDAEQAPYDHVSYSHGSDEALRLLTELSGVSQDGGSGGVEEGVPTGASDTETASETATPESMHSSSDSDADVQWLQDVERDRRCRARAARLHQLRVDSAARCVYGGLCTQFHEPSDEHSACVHPPVFTDRTLQDDYSIDAGGLEPSDRQRNVIAYASRTRWKQQTLRRRRKCSFKKAWTRTQIQKTSIHLNRFAWRSTNPAHKRSNHIYHAKDVPAS